MKNRNLIISGVVAYLVFLLVLTPANTIASLMPLKQNRINITNINGTVWNGNADSLSVNQTQVKQLHWDLKPLNLFMAQLTADINAELYSQKVAATASYSLINQGVALTDVRSTMKASALKEILNLPFGELSGLINLNLAELKLEQKKLSQVTGQLNWMNASLTLSEAVSFGSLKLLLNTKENGDIDGQLTNSGGSLEIKGEITLFKDRRYTLNLKLTPRSQAPAELLSMLRLIAPNKQGSTHQLNRQGHLNQLGIAL